MAQAEDAMLSTLRQIAVPDPDARRAAMRDILARKGFAFRLQQSEPTEQKPRGVCNFLLEPEEAEPSVLFCAHYDAYPASSGANDNGAAVAILTQLADELRRQGVRAGFAFFDGEEDGHSGARLFESQAGERVYAAIVNLDMCGYGDTLTVCSHGRPSRAAARPFCDKERLRRYGGRMVRYLPESDDICFHAHKQPVLSLAIMPKWDARYMDVLASYNGSFLGLPPEFRQILSQLEVAGTMHGAFHDGVQWVQPAAMHQVYGYLLDAMTAPPEKRRRLFEIG